MTSSARRREPAPEVSGPVDACAVDDVDTTQESTDLGESVVSPSVDWTDLPDAVRSRLAEIAADAVGEIPALDIPQPVRAVARFAPAKRARLGAVPLLSGLRGFPAFRTAVTEWAREHRPTVLDLTASDPTAAATAALLLADGSAVHYLELVRRRALDATLRAERDTAVTRATKLEAELTRVRTELNRAEGNAGQVVGERDAELEKLLKRLREQGVRLREARDEAAAARADAEQMRVQTELDRKSLTAERDRERERADAERAKARRAEADAQAARQAAREARQADEVRLQLLVDTLDGAVTGLRRELALGGSGPRPADLVRGASAAQSTVGRVADPAALDRLLALPTVHLVVDGYNVTKTGYPELPLVDQRDRLVHQLAALAARTGAEVTLVFDGAGVVSVPSAAPRGVRVLFSDPGVLADDVIRALVTAEPEGRPVVVVTSDRAVADSVRRRGAHPVPSAVLLARISRV
ncbi:MAG TPA: NYN domain-containing protein [Pseudonocardiaceae bacterium]|jgi:predicted RNA-binding protein with PIN domain|nr:NYN domain-containing protein [Pseudonocardiaceae bacterium]